MPTDGKANRCEAVRRWFASPMGRIEMSFHLGRLRTLEITGGISHVMERAGKEGPRMIVAPMAHHSFPIARTLSLASSPLAVGFAEREEVQRAPAVPRPARGSL